MLLDIISDLQSDFGGVLDIIEVIIRIICIVVPVILVIICSVDFAKAVTSQDNEALKKAMNTSFKRLIAGAIIFLLPFVVSFIMQLVGGSDYERAGVDGTFNIVEQDSQYS
ncbi:MAG: hypothetical protein ACM3O4_01545 [Ignavibacteriales bacterium]